MSYEWEIKFCSCGSKIRDLIWNLQQNHLSFCNTIKVHNQFPANKYIENMVRNLFKVNNNDTRTMPPCSSVFIFNFEQVNASWVCLYLATSFPKSLGFLIRRKASSFLPSYQKANMLWEQGCVSSYSMKIELWSWTQVSHITKNFKIESKSKN